MAALETRLDFLRRHEKYEEEKPYFIIPLAGSHVNPDTDSVTNLEFESQGVKVLDMRRTEHSIQHSGFQFVFHTSNNLTFKTPVDVDTYKKETEAMLSSIFPDAEEIVTWDFRLRKNEKYTRRVFDMNDPLLVEGPAKGAHDATIDSGPSIIMRYLDEPTKLQYFQSGYRFRLINTWRSLVDGLKDRPLAVCDFRTLDLQDLVAADRVYPQRVGEIYYLYYNEQQQWYWLSDQTCQEVIVAVMYDSKAGQQAKFCPHVSFDNPEAGTDAATRESVETRSILISRE